MRAHWQYLRYVARHKWFVWCEGLKLGVNPLALFLHDWTKFLPGEWFPYVSYFYGKPDYETNADVPMYVKSHFDWTTRDSFQRDFDRAWNHHQKANRHHWQHWVLLMDDGSTKVLPMPMSDLREMVADWRGAGRAIHGHDETAAWYAKNHAAMQLHPTTRHAVEALLGVQTHEAVPKWRWA